jgi:hypothetical protein
MGRSTTGTIIATLIYNWLGGESSWLGAGDGSAGSSSPLPLRKIIGSDPSVYNSFISATSSTKKFQRVNYTIINTLLRVVKNGMMFGVNCQGLRVRRLLIWLLISVAKS